VADGRSKTAEKTAEGGRQRNCGSRRVGLRENGIARNATMT
jgi:hypothetical protein